MVFNVTKKDIRVRMAAYDEDIWPLPSVTKKESADPKDRVGFSDYITGGKINFINAAGIPSTLSFDTQARLGVAYRNHLMTLGADLDLIESDALLTSQNFQALKSQYISVGGEFNLLNFIQLRIGAQKNIADGISSAAKDNLYTAGIGFWFGFNLDLALVSQNDSLGGFLQSGFRF